MPSSSPAPPAGAPRILALSKAAGRGFLSWPQPHSASTPSSALHAPTPSRSAVIFPSVSLQHRPVVAVVDVPRAHILGVGCRWTWVVLHAPSRLYLALSARSCRRARWTAGVLRWSAWPMGRCWLAPASASLVREAVVVYQTMDTRDWLDAHAVDNGLDCSSSAYAHLARCARSPCGL
ncbi:hypothetical protein B0H13DRAFT_2400788 [Mycena leptocephala]|nr:hypothetical protein B0H13DRAFT_2400788 [Mycena leptocephala]